MKGTTRAAGKRRRKRWLQAVATAGEVRSTLLRMRIRPFPNSRVTWVANAGGTFSAWGGGQRTPMAA